MKNDYKILVLSTVHEYDDARIFFKQIPSIKKEYPNLYYMAQHPGDSELVENNTNIIPLPLTTSRFTRFFKLQYLALKKIRELKPDVIHFHDPELMILMWYIKKTTNIKTIFDIHDVYVEFIQIKPWLPNFMKAILPPVYNVIESMFIKSCDRLIIVFDTVRKYYGKDAIIIKNYPLLSTKTAPENKSFFGPLNLVYVGIMTEDRGAMQVLQIFKNLTERFEDFHLDLIGRIDTDELKEKIYSFIDANNLSDQVTIHGSMSIVKVYEILQKSHFGFSLMEPNSLYLLNLSTKIFDYMANGVPYLVTNIDVYDKYTINECTGITANYDPDESTAKIIELFNDRALMQTMSRNGIKAAEEKWNWDAEGRKLLAMYNDLLSK